MSGGGGGGGDRDKLQASQGRLPKQSMQQITPPMAVVRNLQPKLEVAPTIVVPPEFAFSSPTCPTWRPAFASAVCAFEWNGLWRRHWLG